MDTYLDGQSKLEVWRGHLGNATKEMGPFDLSGSNSWYKDSTVMAVGPDSIFFLRGYYMMSGMQSGITTSGYGMGDTWNVAGTRFVLL